MSERRAFAIILILICAAAFSSVWVGPWLYVGFAVGQVSGIVITDLTRAGR